MGVDLYAELTLSHTHYDFVSIWRSLFPVQFIHHLRLPDSLHANVANACCLHCQILQTFVLFFCWRLNGYSYLRYVFMGVLVFSCNVPIFEIIDFFFSLYLFQLLISFTLFVFSTMMSPLHCGINLLSIISLIWIPTELYWRGNTLSIASLR